MEYNICITHFALNKCSVRIYKNSIHSNDEKTLEIQNKREFVKEFNKENNIEPDKDWSDYVSKNRTINNIWAYGRGYNWDYFITLTFNASRVNRYDYTDCMESARKYFDYVKRYNAPDLKYMLVPEHHKDGAYHIHGSLADTGDIPFIDSGLKDDFGRIIYNMPTYIYGWSTATKCDNNFAVSSYMTKYITKELASETKFRQRYIISKNLEKPVQTVLNLSSSKQLEFIEDLSANINFSKKLEYDNQEIQYLEVSDVDINNLIDKYNLMLK